MNRMSSFKFKRMSYFKYKIKCKTWTGWVLLNISWISCIYKTWTGWVLLNIKVMWNMNRMSSFKYKRMSYFKYKIKRKTWTGWVLLNISWTSCIYETWTGWVLLNIKEMWNMNRMSSFKYKRIFLSVYV